MFSVLVQRAFGSLAAGVLIPERNVGFYIAVNSEEGEMVRGLMYELLDHYLGLRGWRTEDVEERCSLARPRPNTCTCS